MQLSLIFVYFLQLFSLAVASPLPASELSARSSGPSSIQNYILVFEDGTSTPDSVLANLQDKLKNLGVKINYEYQTIIKGFSVSLESSLVSKLHELNDKSYPFILEQDKGVHTA